MSKDTTSYTQTLPTKLVSHTYSIHAWLYPVVLVTAMLFLGGCQETAPGDTGLGVLPDDDLIGLVYTDTIAPVLETQWLDKVVTGNAPSQLFGNYYDASFGRINAISYSEARIPGADLDFGDAADLKYVSLTLNLDLVNVYGRFDAPQELQVYELNEAINDDQTVLTSDLAPLAVRGTELSEGYTIDFRDDASFSDLSIPLHKSLGEKLLFADPSHLKDNETFSNFFKGLAIGTKTTGFQLSRESGGIYAILLNSVNSNLKLNYQRKDSAGVFVNDSIEFIINEAAQKFHLVQRSGFDDLVLDEYANTANGGLYEFAQGGAMIRTFVNVPGLSSFDKIGINRAELVLKVDKTFLGSADRYAPPTNLWVFLADENQQFLRDDEGRVTLFTSVGYDATNGQYELNMTAQAQLVVSGQRENHGFILVPSDSATSVNRAVFGGVDHPTLHPTFKLTYTTLPK